MAWDPLTDVLASIRFTGAMFFVIDGAAPWVAEGPSTRVVSSRVMPHVDHVLEFHAVTRGRCLGGIAGEELVPLEAGDVICFPHGDANVLSSERGLRCAVDLSIYEGRPGAPVPFPVRVGKGTPADRVLCGFLGFDIRPFNPLLSTLPRVLRASDRDGSAGGWLSRLVSVAEEEAQNPRPGRDAVMTRVSELMFVEVVRRHLESLPADRTGWLAGVRDAYVGQALSAIHARPGEPWSIEALGREVGLSRSAVAERFTALIGEPPMQYLARWRMQVAAGLLASTHDGIAAIGARVGYGSEAAFNRAFKKMVGVPPAAWGRRRRGPPT